MNNIEKDLKSMCDIFDNPEITYAVARDIEKLKKSVFAIEAALNENKKDVVIEEIKSIHEQFQSILSGVIKIKDIEPIKEIEDPLMQAAIMCLMGPIISFLENSIKLFEEILKDPDKYMELVFMLNKKEA